MGTYENFMELPDSDKKKFFELIQKITRNPSISTSRQSQPSSSLTDEARSFVACLAAVSQPSSPERKSSSNQKTLDQWVVKTSRRKTLPPNFTHDHSDPNFELERAEQHRDENNTSILPSDKGTPKIKLKSRTETENDQEQIFKEMKSGRKPVVLLERANLKDYLFETRLCSSVDNSMSEVSQVSSSLPPTLHLNDAVGLIPNLSENQDSLVPDLQKSTSESLSLTNSYLYNLRSQRHAIEPTLSSKSPSSEVSNASDSKKAEVKESGYITSEEINKIDATGIIPVTKQKQPRKKLCSKKSNENSNESSTYVNTKKLKAKGEDDVNKTVSPIGENWEMTIENVASNAIFAKDAVCLSGFEQINASDSHVQMNSKRLNENIVAESRTTKDTDSDELNQEGKGEKPISDHTESSVSPKEHLKKKNIIKNRTPETLNKGLSSLTKSDMSNNCMDQSTKMHKDSSHASKVLSESGRMKLNCKSKSSANKHSNTAAEKKIQTKNVFKLKNIIPQSLPVKNQKKKNLHSKEPGSETPTVMKIKVEKDLHYPACEQESNEEAVKKQSESCGPVIAQTLTLSENSKKKRGRPCKKRNQSISPSATSSVKHSPHNSDREIDTQNSEADAEFTVSPYDNDLDVQHFRSRGCKRITRSSSGSSRLSNELHGESHSPSVNSSTLHKNKSGTDKLRSDAQNSSSVHQERNTRNTTSPDQNLNNFSNTNVPSLSDVNSQLSNTFGVEKINFPSPITNNTFEQKSNRGDIQCGSKSKSNTKECISKWKNSNNELENLKISDLDYITENTVPSLQNNAEPNSNESSTDKTDVSSNDAGMSSSIDRHTLSTGSKKCKKKTSRSSVSKKLPDKLENIVVTFFTDGSSNKEERISSTCDSVVACGNFGTLQSSGPSPRKKKKDSLKPENPNVGPQASTSYECAQNCTAASVLSTLNSKSSPIVVQTNNDCEASPSYSNLGKSEKQPLKFKPPNDFDLKSLVVTVRSQNNSNTGDTVTPFQSSKSFSRQILLKSELVDDQISSSSTAALKEINPTVIPDSYLETDEADPLNKSSSFSPHARLRKRKKSMQASEQAELSPLKCSITVGNSISANDVVTPVILNYLDIHGQPQNTGANCENVEIPSDIERQLDDFINAEKNFALMEEPFLAVSEAMKTNVMDSVSKENCNIETSGSLYSTKEMQLNYEEYCELSNLCSSIGVNLDELFQNTDVLNCIKTGSSDEVFIIRGHKLTSGHIVPSICKTNIEYCKLLHEMQVNSGNKT